MNKRNAPIKIDPADRPAELDELNFEENKPAQNEEDQLMIEQNDPTVRDVGLTEASRPGQGPTNDDLSPETLILEDGARSPEEYDAGNAISTDKTLSIVNDTEIGAGYGLDEAELAELDPVNAKKVPDKS